MGLINLTNHIDAYAVHWVLQPFLGDTKIQKFESFLVQDVRQLYFQSKQEPIRKIISDAIEQCRNRLGARDFLREFEIYNLTIEFYYHSIHLATFDVLANTLMMVMLF